MEVVEVVVVVVLAVVVAVVVMLLLLLLLLLLVIATTISALTRLQVMVQNVERLLERGEKIELLVPTRSVYYCFHQLNHPCLPGEPC